MMVGYGFDYELFGALENRLFEFLAYFYWFFDSPRTFFFFYLFGALHFYSQETSRFFFPMKQTLSIQSSNPDYMNLQTKNTTLNIYLDNILKKI